MKLKRLLSLAGFIAAILFFTGARLYAVDAISVTDAEAFSGGSDTVEVYITTDQAYLSAEVSLTFDQTKLKYVEGSLDYNINAWNPSWGDPLVSYDSTTGELRVGFVSFVSTETQIPKSTAPLKLFSVVLEVAQGVAQGPVTVTPSGLFVTGENESKTVTTLNSGTFTVKSNFQLEVDSVEAGFGISTPVEISLTNYSEVLGIDLALSFDSTQLAVDSVVLNTDLWAGVTPQLQVDSTDSDSLRISIFAVATTGISISSTPRWIAKVYMKTAEGAVVSADNPIKLEEGIVTVLDDAGELTSNSAVLVDGNFEIMSKYSLRVSRDAAAPLGASDTVKVYLRNTEAVVAVEAELKFDPANFTVDTLSLVTNAAIYSGDGASVSVVSSSTDSTLRVGYITVSLDSIAPSTEEKLLFSVVLNAKDTATPGVDTLEISGQVTTSQLETVEIPAGAITKGTFHIRSQIEYQVQSVVTKPQTTKTVNILLTNRYDVLAADLFIRFNPDSLKYVNGSLSVNNDIWESGTPEVLIDTSATDTVRVGLFVSGTTIKIPASSASQRLLSLDFAVDSSLGNGDVAWLEVGGLVTILDSLGEIQSLAATGVPGYVSVVHDISPPDPVTEVAWTVTATAISLSWENPTDADLSHIIIVRKPSEGAEDTVYNSLGAAEIATAFVDSNLTAGLSYRYVFTAFDQVGNASDTVSTDLLTPVSVEKNYLEVISSGTYPGGETTVSLDLLSVSEWISGVGLALNFDQTKLQVTKVEPGANAAGLTVEGVDLNAANTTGSLVVSLLDLTSTNPVSHGKYNEVLLVTFSALEDAAAGDTLPLTLTSVSLSNPSAVDVPVETVDGELVVSDAVLSLSKGWAHPGEVDSIKVISSSGSQIAGAGFTVVFDQTKLQISAAHAGVDAGGLDDPLLASAVATANTSGRLVVNMVDASLANPVAAGSGKELLVITFQVSDTVAVAPARIPVRL
ncbi:MAG: hypothetical protein DRG82_15855, partial [Deltaproteobacteria bacterium]